MSSLVFTGERFLPGIKGQISYEHRHRYAVCRQFVAGRKVLDAACGEGYGSALLAITASEVVGLDIDRATVDHAAATYRAPKLSFRQGDCRDLPFPDASFDVVVSLETIEHLSEPERLLAEARRVLRPDGILIVSTPNRQVYSERNDYKNPFHEREYSLEEFESLVRSVFKFTSILGQRFYIGSAVGNVLVDEQHHSYAALRQADPDIEELAVPITNPKYFVAICSSSTEVARVVRPSIFIDGDDDLWEENEKVRSWASGLHHELDQANASARRREDELRREIDEHRQQTVEAENLAGKAETAAENLAERLRRRIADSQNEMRAGRKRARRAAARLRRLRTSTSWRITAPLRLDIVRHPRRAMARVANAALNWLRPRRQSKG